MMVFDVLDWLADRIGIELTILLFVVWVMLLVFFLAPPIFWLIGQTGIMPYIASAFQWWDYWLR